MRMRARQLMVLSGIVLVQFGLFEAALRLAGGSEAAPAFQRLFLSDPVIGYRLRPSTDVRFTTAEFSTDISINSAGVRDAEIGPKAPGERRILVLGDSLVLAVQVPLEQTFCKRLEAALNASAAGPRYRVIDAGVQGYGPVEEALFYERVGSRLQPDLVLVVTFVANDAIEAVDRAFRLGGDAASSREIASVQRRDAFWRVVRRSMVLQIVGQRVAQLREHARLGRPAAPDPRLLMYATPEIEQVRQGLRISREVVGRLADDARRDGARTAIVLMPARLQLDDEEFARMRAIVEPAGYHMTTDGATVRFREALDPLGLPMLDLLPAFRAAPNPRNVFFESTVHLTPTGHQVTADAIGAFLDAHHLVP